MSGSDDEFEVFVVASWPGLVRFARLVASDTHQAEDLAQSALARTFAKWSSLRDVTAAEAYARTVLIRLSMRAGVALGFSCGFGIGCPEGPPVGDLVSLPGRQFETATALGPTSPPAPGVGVGMPIPEDIAAGGNAVMATYPQGNQSYGGLPLPESAAVVGTTYVYNTIAGTWMRGPKALPGGASTQKGTYWTPDGVVSLNLKESLRPVGSSTPDGSIAGIYKIMSGPRALTLNQPGNKRLPPIAHAAVTLTSASGQVHRLLTDRRGRFEISLPTGKYRVSDKCGDRTSVEVRPGGHAFLHLFCLA